jgi:hypothetical protein
MPTGEIMKKVCFYSTALVVILFASAAGRIINVPADYEYIQDAIYASNDGDTVLISTGLYHGTLNFYGRNIVLASLFLTTHDTTYIRSTIIDANFAGSVITLENGEDSTAAIIGLTIQFGRAFYDGHSTAGGGIKCRGASPMILNNHIIKNDARDPYAGSGGAVACLDSSNCLIKNNLISSNITTAYGGGILCYRSSPIIDGNLIVANFLDPSEPIGGGAGIACLNSPNVVITGNVIRDNSGTEFTAGGGLAINSARSVTNNVIQGNSAYYGGGASVSGRVMTITGNLIVGNSAAGVGGGVMLSTSCTFVNNVISDNMADDGGGIYCEGDSATLINDIFWGNSPNQIRDHYTTSIASYSDIQGGFLGEGNIDTFPAFRNPINGDYHLMALSCGDSTDSPCIDAGHPDSIDAEMSCRSGLGTSRCDMGAYGGSGNITAIDDESHDFTPTRISLSQNYPNPFNPSTTIAYQLASDCHLRIDIFDVMGRSVAVLDEGEKRAGEYQVGWNAGRLSSGVYFYRIHAGDKIEIKKMTLLK